MKHHFVVEPGPSSCSPDGMYEFRSWDWSVWTPAGRVVRHGSCRRRVVAVVRGWWAAR